MPSSWNLKFIVALLLTSVVVLHGLVVHAGDDDVELERLESEAASAYSKGDYAQAIDLLLKAHSVSPHPNYVLNIAVSYGKIGDCSNAELFAKNALDSEPPLSKEAKATALQVIERCQKEAVVVTEQVDKPEPAKPVEAPVAPEEPEPGLTALQWSGVGAVGVGFVLGAADLFVYDLALVEDIDEFKGRNQRGELTAAQHQSQEASLASRQGQVLIGYIVSGALITAGVALLVFGGEGQEPAKSPEISVKPVLSGQYGGVQMGVRF